MDEQAAERPAGAPPAPVPVGARAGGSDALRWAIALAGLSIVAVGMVAAQAGRRGVQELSEELSTAHVAARILDVSDEAATRVFVEEIQEAIGPIDVLFAHVGVSTGGGPGTPDELRVRQWRIKDVARLRGACTTDRLDRAR